MEDIELKNMWKANDAKLERLLVLNLKMVEDMQKQKAKSKLKPLMVFRIVAAALGIIWVLFLAFLVLFSLTISKIFFVVSVTMIMFFSIIAVISYIKQAILIKQINNSESIIEAQEKLAVLQSSTIKIMRLVWLQLPFYTTFFLSPAMFATSNIFLWMLPIVITGIFIFFAVWLYRNINYQNRNKRWFRILFSGEGWASILKAIEFLDEIEEFKKEEMPGTKRVNSLMMA